MRNGKKVALITGATLGHDVTLYERANKLGGQLNMAASIPGKFEFKETIRYFEHELKALGVNIKLNAECNLQTLEELNPDAVIFATGVRPRDFKLPGLEKKKVGTYVEYLNGQFTPGNKIAIIGGGGIGCGSANKLLEDLDPTIDEYFAKYNVPTFTDVKIQPHTSKRKLSILRRSGKVRAVVLPPVKTDPIK